MTVCFSCLLSMIFHHLSEKDEKDTGVVMSEWMRGVHAFFERNILDLDSAPCVTRFSLFLDQKVF